MFEFASSIYVVSAVAVVLFLLIFGLVFARLYRRSS